MSTLKDQLNGSLAIERAKEPTELMRPEPEASLTPMSILQLAISQGADIDKLEKLMGMQERWEANAARKAFVAAMAEFKKSSIRIIKDKDNKQYGSKYVSLGNLVNTVTPLLSDHGLSVRWDIDQSSGIKVSCIVTHSMGHFESVSMVCPPDKSGAKNPIQEIKSSITYAKACTFESITGLASTDANVDDDGNSSSGNAQMPLDEFDRGISLIEAADTLAMLQVTFSEAYKAAQKANDKGAQKQFIAAKDKRKAELNANR